MVENNLGLQEEPENLHVNKVWTGQPSSSSCPYIQTGQERGQELWELSTHLELAV